MSGHRRVIPIGNGTHGSCAVVTPGAAAFVAAGSPIVQAVMVEHLRRGGVGRSLIEGAAELIGSPDTSDYPPMTIVAVDHDGAHLLVHGPLHVDIRPARLPTGRSTATGPIASALGDPVVRRFEALDSLFVCSPRPAHDEVTRIDHALAELRDGVVAADGLVISWSREADRRPAPHVVTDPAGPVVQRPRSSLGMLVFDTGEVFEVAGDLSIGRDPSADSLVTSGLARALRPSGDVSGLSRVHATVHLDGWNVTIRDRRSLNGTFVWDRRATQWARLAPGDPTLIRPGDMIGFGRRTATFRTSIQPK